MNELMFWQQRQADRGIDINTVKRRVAAFRMELPSWGFGNAGTRFAVFPGSGAAGTLFEKIDDAAQVHRLTGICPQIAIHIPWDKADDYEKVKQYAGERGLSIGAVNPNLFQDPAYQYGSLCNADPAIRRQAVAHMLECCEIMKATGSNAMSLWLADGTNYPGQGSFRQRRAYLLEALQETMAQLPGQARLLIEYKLFEPAFYHTDLSDWGAALLFAQKLGERAQVLVDLGHHAPGVNVEHIVATLLDEGKLGGFHFNNRKYADDDLIVGAINPYELFLIFLELVMAEDEAATAACANQIAYMIDQSHNIEPKLPAMIRSVLNVQTAHAKALLVNTRELERLRATNDVLGAEAVVREAFEQDVTPLLAVVRQEAGLHPDPMTAYRESGYEASIAKRKPSGGWV